MNIFKVSWWGKRYELRTGALFYGYFKLIFGTVFQCALLFDYLSYNREACSRLCATVQAFLVISWVANILMLFGIHSKRSTLMIHSVVLHFIELLTLLLIITVIFPLHLKEVKEHLEETALRGIPLLFEKEYYKQHIRSIRAVMMEMFKSNMPIMIAIAWMELTLYTAIVWHITAVYYSLYVSIRNQRGENSNQQQNTAELA